jgi:hypothetical protein
MTCCIVVVNRDAPTASLPPFSGPAAGQAGQVPAQPPQPQPQQALAPDQDAPQPLHPAAAPPGLEQPAPPAAAARAH